jgi:molybdenum cofactor biosynthesis enzyme
MCKALTHGIEIREISLKSKTGGKRDYEKPAAGAAAP